MLTYKVKMSAAQNKNVRQQKYTFLTFYFFIV
ncbi:MAG: hypothetical protein ACI9O0_001414, partial [Paracoccaceae bacterium]